MWGDLKGKTQGKRKYIRYLRWASKIAFLILFLIPIAYVPSSEFWQTPYTPVSSVFLGPTKPFFYLPLVESPCSIWLSGWSNPVPGSWLVEPLGAIQALLTGKVAELLLIPTLVGLFLVVALLIVLGVAFCSWACPIGTIVDSFDMAVAKFLPRIEAKRALTRARSIEIRDSKNNILCKSCPVSKAIGKGALANGLLIGSFVAAPLTGFNAFCTVCPIGISTRSLFHLKSTTYLTKFVNPFFIELLIIPILAVFLSLRERRFFCNKLCPVGALFGGISSVNPFIKPKVNSGKCVMKGCPEKCEDQSIDYCGTCRIEDDRKCEKVCPANINLVDGGSLHRCSKCFECYLACEHGAIEMHAAGKPDVFRLRGFFSKLRKRRSKQQTTPTVS